MREPRWAQGGCFSAARRRARARCGKRARARTHMHTNTSGAQEGWGLFVRKHGLCSSPHDPLRGRRVRRRQAFAARRSARGKASRTPVEPSHRCPRHRRELHRCVRMCMVRLPDSEKALPHSKHRYGRFPVCNLMCAVSLFADPKALPHVAHSCRRCSPSATYPSSVCELPLLGVCRATLPPVEVPLFCRRGRVRGQGCCLPFAHWRHWECVAARGAY